MYHIKTIEGQLNASDLKIALVASRFNDFVVDKLVAGALDYLLRHGAQKENLSLAKVPGAFELPLVASKLAKSGGYDGIICLGAVIRGGEQAALHPNRQWLSNPRHSNPAMSQS